MRINTLRNRSQMKLTPQERQDKIVCQEAKDFLTSKLYQAISLHLSSQLDQEFPKPNKRGWEERYRYAKAYEKAATDIMGFVGSLSNRLEALNDKEQDKTDFNAS